jgi:DNA-binding MarR family transcriptional regulator
MGDQYTAGLNGSADACILFRRASRAVTHLYDLVLAPSGLKATRFVLLRAIEQHSESSQSRLAEEYGMSPETLSRRLAGLRRAGFIELQAKPLGGRRPYRLTAAGSRKLQAATPYWARAQQRLRATLGADQWIPILAAAYEVALAARKAENAKIVNTAPKIVNTACKAESVAAAR